MNMRTYKNTSPAKHRFAAGSCATNPTIKQQQGAVLVVSLIMLLVMTLIGISSMRTTVLEEKMASNYRDSNIAFQAAEAALLDAEKDILCIDTTIGCREVSGLTSFDAACTGGLCAGWDAAGVWTTAKMAASVNQSAFTDAVAIPGVVTPQYLVEGKKCIAPGWASYKYCYQITATGFAGTTTDVTATSILQEVYIKP